MQASVAVEERMVPGWLRGLEVFVGLVAIVIGFAVLANPTLAILTLVFLLSWALIIIGLREIMIGIMARWRPTAIRGLAVVAGLIAIVAGFLIIAFPGLGAATLIWLLFLGLFVFGAAEVGVGMGARFLRPSIRGFFVAIGVLNLILAPIVLLFPAIGQLTLVVLLSVTLVVNGVENLVSGAVGRVGVARVAVAPAGRGGSSP